MCGVFVAGAGVFLRLLTPSRLPAAGAGVRLPSLNPSDLAAADALHYALPATAG